MCIRDRAYPVEVTDLYAYPTIAELAAYVGGMGGSADLREQLQEVGRWFIDGGWRREGNAHIAERRDAYAAHVPLASTLGAALDTDAVTYREVLVLGATGFVGVHLLHEVLQETTASVHVLVRPGGAGPAERLRAAYTRFFSDDDFRWHQPRIHLLAVSYTHLDVYKRQGRNTAISRPPPGQRPSGNRRGVLKRPGRSRRPRIGRSQTPWWHQRRNCSRGAGWSLSLIHI